MKTYFDYNFKLVNKHFSNELQYRFWKDGYIQLPIDIKKTDDEFILRLKELYENRKDFFIKKKYINSHQKDFKGKVEEYNFCLNLLKKNKLLEKLKFISCSDLVLSNITIRINQNTKKNNSFWGPHRDTSFLTNKSIKGNVPPLKHLIYYPEFSNLYKNVNELMIWVGSHRRMYSGILDDFFSMFEKKTIIKSDNNKMTFFEGSVKHAIGFTSNPKGNLRLIFSFLDRRQIFPEIEHYSKIQKWNELLDND